MPFTSIIFHSIYQTAIVLFLDGPFLYIQLGNWCKLCLKALSSYQLQVITSFCSAVT